MPDLNAPINGERAGLGSSGDEHEGSTCAVSYLLDLNTAARASAAAAAVRGGALRRLERRVAAELQQSGRKSSPLAGSPADMPASRAPLAPGGAAQAAGTQAAATQAAVPPTALPAAAAVPAQAAPAALLPPAAPAALQLLELCLLAIVHLQPAGAVQSVAAHARCEIADCEACDRLRNLRGCRPVAVKAACDGTAGTAGMLQMQRLSAHGLLVASAALGQSCESNQDSDMITAVCGSAAGVLRSLPEAVLQMSPALVSWGCRLAPQLLPPVLSAAAQAADLAKAQCVDHRAGLQPKGLANPSSWGGGITGDNSAVGRPEWQFLAGKRVDVALYAAAQQRVQRLLRALQQLGAGGVT